MPLLKDGKLVDDIWRDVADDADVPGSGGVIVSAERWRAERESLRGRNAPLGVRLKNDQPPVEIADALDKVDVVVLEFPVYTNGRAFSSARLLRERYGFKGEVRARGNVLRDQYKFMKRCGFNAFEVADDVDPAAWERTAATVPHVYQPAADGIGAVWAKRHGRSADL